MSLIRYTMGHITDTYQQVKSKGIEYMRSEYAKADLRIRPKTQESRPELLETLAKSVGFGAEEVNKIKTAFAEPHRMVAISEQVKEKQYAQFIPAKLKELASS